MIVVNLDTGSYYSLLGSAADIWAAVERGASVDQTVEHALQLYDAPRAVVEPAVTGFVDELASEGLIVAANGNAAEPIPLQANDAPGAFTPPLLSKYTDMQELLLLDPIHEVDERGWPSSLADAPQASEA